VIDDGVPAVGGRDTVVNQALVKGQKSGRGPRSGSR
jgi:hypothetical protein